MTGLWRLRAAVLTLVGALILHQGRYLLAPREHDHELAGAHHYLAWLMPVLAGVLFLGVIQLVVSMHRVDDAQTPELPSARAMWLAESASLLTVFGLQETVELTAVHGHLPQLMDLLGHGGWQVALFAPLMGGALALLLRGAARVAGWALRRHGSAVWRHAPVPAPPPPAPVLVSRGPLLARNLAGRAPPSLS